MEPTSLSLKIGDTDTLGNKVTRVFAREQVKKYAIWETEKGEVVIDADDESLFQHPDVQRWVIKVVGLQSQRPLLKSKYNSYVAHAYKLFFDGGPPACISVLKSLYEDLFRQLQRQAKLAFLLGASSATALCVLTCALLYFRRFPNDLLERVLAGTAVSALGGFMSVASGLRKLQLDLEETSLVSALYGGVRIVVAIIAGVVATLLIRTGAILSFLQQKDAFSGFLVVCFVAGFSERFVYKALRNIENDVA
jgi:hypothetical protein